MELLSRKTYSTFILVLILLVWALLVYYQICGPNRQIYSSDPGTLMSPLSEIMTKLNNTNLRADDPKLIYLLRNFYIKKPSHLPYNLRKPTVLDASQRQQAVYIDKLLNQKTNGFFVECGADSGEKGSNTLFFERHRNWTGVLIEPNPIAFKELRSKNRNAFTLNVCLTAHPSVETLHFDVSKTTAGNIIGQHYLKKKHIGVLVQVPCFPLYSILLALGKLKVDYFSLDIEGAERWVLDSIPWTKVDIKVMSIEYQFWSGGNQSLTKYMETKGYKLIKTLTAGNRDIIVQKQYSYQD